MDSKVCSRCKELKVVEDFHWKNKAAGVLQRQCKACHKLVNAKHYSENKDTYKRRAQKQRTDVRDWLAEYKLTLCCESCGENHPATLDFHHHDPSHKDSEVSDLVGRASLDKIKSEIAKCTILCANCHRKLHYRERNLNKLP